MSKKVTVVAYNAEWPEIYIEESQRIKKILVDNCVTMHHVGSTSIPELDAKPIIDIMVIVKHLKLVDKINHQMENMGYEAKGEYGFILRRFFVKENQFHIHVFEEGHSEIERILKFRDWLRSHQED